MSASRIDTPSDWIDPDDAPELTDEWLDRADLHENGVLIRRGRPPAEARKERITIRLDGDVAAAFRATGKGWQTRLNAVMRVQAADREAQVGSAAAGGPSATTRLRPASLAA
jgi:uncharacterized protein (DUF4415 family)